MRDMEEVVQLPLYLIHGDSNLAYIIDNQIFGCTKLASIGYYGAGKSLNMISQFYHLVKDSFVFPEPFQIFFENYQPIEIKDTFNLFIGGKGYFSSYYLDFTISKEQSHIVFDKFIFNDDPLDFRVVLQPNEAFLIFINHMINCSYNSLRYNHENQSITYFEIERTRFSNDSEYNDFLQKMMFTKICTEYLLEEIQIGNLSPGEILRLNGPYTLNLFKTVPVVQNYLISVFEKLLLDILDYPLTRNVVYISLLSAIDNYWYFANFPVFKEFNQKMVKIRDRLFETIETTFLPYKSKYFDR